MNSRWLTSRTGIAAVRRTAEIGRIRGAVALKRGLSAVYLEQLNTLADKVQNEDDRSKWMLLLAVTISAEQIRQRLYPTIERTITTAYRTTLATAGYSIQPQNAATEAATVITPEASAPGAPTPTAPKTPEILRPTPATVLKAESSAAANVAENIAKTTKDDLASIIDEAIQGNLSPQDLADKLRLRKDYLRSRAATAAGTEIGIAWDTGARLALADAGVRYVSVVGCSRIEPEWSYNGTPTCNIKNVPIEEAGNLIFHPNHTGVMIPSAGPQ